VIWIRSTIIADSTGQVDAVSEKVRRRSAGAPWS